MFVYLLQVFVLQLIFFVFYQLFLKKETFFRLNRFYLLGSVLLSAVLPLLRLSLGNTQEIVYEQLQPVILGTKHLQGNIEKMELPDYFLHIYIIGIIVGLILFGIKLFKLWRLYRRGNKYFEKNYIIVRLNKFQQAFSFWNIVFLDNNFSEEEKQKILAHELIHIRCRHTLDLLLMELFKIVLWWNPVIYLYQKALELQHEYAADKNLLEKYEINEYYGSILKQVFRVQNISFVNQFYKKSLIKKRIIMQKKQKSQKSALIKYVSFLIIAMGMGIFLNACNNKIKDDHKNNNQESKEKYNKTDKDIEVAYQFIKNPPVYPGCEGLEGEEAKSCMQKNIQKFIMDNFNSKLADSLGIKDNIIRILTMFTIDKHGKVTNIKTRAKYKPFSEEAKRVIALLPKMKPGMQEDKPVKVVYTLPIILKQED